MELVWLKEAVVVNCKAGLGRTGIHIRTLDVAGFQLGGFILLLYRVLLIPVMRAVMPPTQIPMLMSMAICRSIL